MRERSKEREWKDRQNIDLYFQDLTAKSVAASTSSVTRYGEIVYKSLANF